MLIDIEDVTVAVVASLKACSGVVDRFDPSQRSQAMAEVIAAVQGAFSGLTQEDGDPLLETICKATCAAVRGGEL
jgi:hypothetical protein